MFARRLRFRWLDNQWQKLRKHSLQIGPSFTGNALIISRSANRSRAGHLPQMTQSSSEIICPSIKAAEQMRR
jgi:hypothetical protein